MADDFAQDSDYCSALVRARDEDRWLAARYAMRDLRRRLMTLYAFHCELRRIPSSVSEPPLGEIRLQWWREAFQEIREAKPPRAHPVVSELAAMDIGSIDFKPQIDAMIEAAARPLYGERFDELDDLAEWLAQISGAADGLAVKLLGGDNALAETAVKAGTGFALAREGSAWAPSMTDEIAIHVQSIAKATMPALKNAPTEISPALLHLSLTKLYAKRGAAPFDLAKRLQLFSAMAFRRY